MRLLSEYEIVSMSPGVIKAKVSGENLIIRIFLVPLHVFENEGKFSVQVTAVTTADTDKPKFGEVCLPQKTMSHNGVPPESVEVIVKPRLEIRVGDKVIEGTLEVTNVTVFPDLRDPNGSPCVMVSWVLFQTVR
ncbi:hypothetical protein [Sulfurisphaera tokodaii]|nr:hypothetical protein [Sulfurisphaera tokodaii]HII74191.1 hypothetical protein [Sulfurisphaera tokodaii]